jgi:hypothetical protein
MSVRSTYSQSQHYRCACGASIEAVGRDERERAQALRRVDWKHDARETLCRVCASES